MIELPATPLSRTEYSRFAGEILRERPESLRWLKLSVLSSQTVDFLKPYLVVEAARRGIGLDLWASPYGQIEQQALHEGSELFRTSADAVLILPQVEELAPDLTWRFLALSAEDRAAACDHLQQRLENVITGIRRHSSMKILVGNLLPPAWTPGAALEAMQEKSFGGLLRDLNESLTTLCLRTPEATVLDMVELLRQVGMNQWRDERMAWLARAPLSGTAMTALARLTTRQMRSWFTPPKKCLVLDMDNTLWGGVLGEAGLEGIQLGPDYPGNVFVDFQRRILALRDQGVLLAAASKNNAADVEQVLEEHPSCVLKKRHFSAFEVHWEDKATSLRRIAGHLNIGLDSLVFFDDNAVEREWVKSQLPEVSVIEVPTSPLEYGRSLEQAELFDRFTLTDEDRQRAELYQQESVRTQLLASSASLDDFIRSLEMTVTVGKLDEATLPRVVQLLGKTNQFNLTTRRHGPVELRQMLAGGAVGLWARVQDRFGDTGLVAAALALKEDETWVIDTFLMSCRVIGRGVETALLGVLERLVYEQGGREITGCFIPTTKNQPAADFFARHGYHRLGTEADGRWHLRLDELRPLPDAFAITGLSLES